MLNKTVTELQTDWKIEGFEFEYGLAAGAYKENYIPKDYVTANIPCTVQNAMFLACKIADPYQKFNCLEIRWMEDREWWYFKDFATPEMTPEQRVFIRFEGITYRAEVWVNGIQAGRIEGMFRTDEFDVTDYLNPGKNRLTLRIRAQEHAILDAPNALPDQIRTQGPVAQSMSKWNWCPHLVCIGIWQPVKLLLKSKIAVDLVRIRTLSVNLENKDGIEAPQADAAIQLEWDIINHDSREKKITVEFSIDGETFDGKVFSGQITSILKPNSKTTLSKTISLTNAKLWWPNGLGRAELHKLSSMLKNIDGGNIESTEIIFGIRKITFLRNEDEQQVIKNSGHTERPWSMVGEMYKWTFVVNGRKFFLKGSNWVKLDVLLRLEKERYAKVLLPARAGGLNFLRIWGGSLAETEEFYDLCDRYGILCWQEFWLACGNYPAMNHDVFIRCVQDTVRRLINRTSLAYYSGGNEYEPDNRENKVLVDKIAAAVKNIDQEREFRRGSPYKGDRHGGMVMTPLVTRNKYLDILYGNRRSVLMRSEVATGRSTPLLSNLEKMIPENSRWPMEEKIWRHFFAVPPEFKMFANEYDALDSFKHAVFANYFAHAWLCRYNMEYCRSQMFKCSANLNWQLNAPWPCMHREIIEYTGVLKPAFYHYANASKPRIGTVDIERYVYHPGEIFNPPLYLVNDWRKTDDALFTLQLLNTDAEILYSMSRKTAIPENASLKIASPDFKIPPQCAGKTLFVKTELRINGEAVHDNLYWIAVSNHQIAENSISLCGEWVREDGSAVTIPGNDMNIINKSFETVFAAHDDNSKGSLEHAGEDTSEAMTATPEKVIYRKKFIMPENLQNIPLEFYSPGIEGSDEVWINGVMIGSHNFKNPVFDQRTWAFIPHGKKASSSDIDPDSEYFFYSDPLLFAKLDSRFYDIPAGLLKVGAENEIVLVLKTYYQKAIANIMEIRPATPNRQEVNDYFKRGKFFSELRRMKNSEVTVSVNAAQNTITVENLSPYIALGVIIELIPESSGLPIALTDNMFTLLPGTNKILHPLLDTSITLPAELRVYGWNVEDKKSHIK